MSADLWESIEIEKNGVHHDLFHREDGDFVAGDVVSNDGLEEHGTYFGIQTEEPGVHHQGKEDALHALESNVEMKPNADRASDRRDFDVARDKKAERGRRIQSAAKVDCECVLSNPFSHFLELPLPVNQS